MANKICTKCEKEKGEDGFHWANRSKGNKHPQCKICRNDYQKQWTIDNLEYRKMYRQNNTEQERESGKQYRIDNKDKEIKRHRKYKQENKHIVNAGTAKRRAQKRNQTPILTENEKAKIELYYKIAQYLGEEWHVDHVYPSYYGGLHHPNNLQITTKEYNLQKSDKLDFREPETLEYFRI